MGAQPRTTILVVDGTETSREATARVLQHEGFEVRQAASGAEGLRLAGERPDLIVLDLNLPDIDGFEVRRRLREDPSTASILIVHRSATYAGAESKGRGLESGADAYLTSPVEPEVLIATVKTLLRLRRAEAMLRASEEWFRMLVESMDDVVFTLDREQRHTAVFGRWLDTYGLTPQDFLGRMAREIFGAERAAVHEAANHQALGGETAVYEWFTGTGGRTLHFESSVSPLRDASGAIAGIVGVGRDITRRKQAEEAARTLGDVSRRLVESLDPNEATHQIVSSVLRLLGARRSVLFRYDAAAATLVCVAQAGQTSGHPWIGQVMAVSEGLAGLVARDQCMHWSADVLDDARLTHSGWLGELIRGAGLGAAAGAPLTVAGRLLGVLVLADTIGRRWDEGELRLMAAFADQAALALENARLYTEAREARDFLQSIVENSADAIVTTDLRGRITYFSPGAEEIFGYPAGEAVGRRLADHYQFGENEARAVVRRLETEGRIRNYESRYLARDGRWVDASVSISPLRDAGGIVVGALGVGKDITDRKRAEAEAERRRAESETRREEAEALVEVARHLSGTLDLDAVAQLITDSVRRLFRAQSATLYRLEPRSGDLIGLAGSGEMGPAFRRGIVMPRGNGVVGLAVRERQPVRTADFLTDPRVRLDPEVRARIERAPYRAVLALPLCVEEKVMGVLSVADGAGRQFDEGDLRLAQAFADHAAVALHNAHLLSELRVKRVRLETLVEVIRDLSRIRPLPALLSAIAQACGRLLDADSVRFRVVEGDELVMAAAWGHVAAAMPAERLRIGECFPGVVASTGSPLTVEDLAGDPRLIASHRDAAVRLGLHPALGVPVKMGGRVVGVLTAVRRDGRPFSEDDVAIASAFASQAAIAIENARLYDQVELRRREAEELARLAWSVAENLDLRAVAEQVVESVAVLFCATWAVLRLIEGDGTLVAVAAAGTERDLFKSGHVLAPGTGVAGRAAAEATPVWSSDVLSDPGIALDEEARRRLSLSATRAAVAVPLLLRPCRQGGEVAGIPSRPLRGQVVGTLSFGDRRARSFSEAEVRLLQGFADHAAVAIQNARLHDERERQRHEAQVLAELARTINSSLDLEAVLRRIAEAGRDLCGAEVAAVALREPDSEAMVLRCRLGARHERREEILVEPGKGIGGQVLVTGRPFRTDDYAENSRITPDYLDMIRAEGLRALMAVPIRSGDRIEGLLYLGNRVARPFTDRDEAIVLRLADHAAIALRNAVLFERERRARAEAEVSQAASRQLSLRLVEVQEAERRDIARELHDEIGQILTGLKFSLEAVARSTGEAAGERLGDAQALLDELAVRVRELSLDLRPAMLDDLGLPPALLWYLERYRARTGIEVDFSHAGVEGERFAPSVETAAYRIVQEALTNVARHSGVTSASVRCWVAGDTVHVEIEDGGVGFESAAVAAWSGGVTGMQERAALVGGRLAIEAVPGAGVRVMAELPIVRRVGEDAR